MISASNSCFLEDETCPVAYVVIGSVIQIAWMFLLVKFVQTHAYVQYLFTVL